MSHQLKQLKARKLIRQRRSRMGEQRKGQREKSPAVAETSGDTENEFERVS